MREDGPCKANRDQHTSVYAIRSSQTVGESRWQEQTETASSFWLPAASWPSRGLEGKSGDIPTEEVISSCASQSGRAIRIQQRNVMILIMWNAPNELDQWGRDRDTGASMQAKFRIWDIFILYRFSLTVPTWVNADGRYWSSARIDWPGSRYSGQRLDVNQYQNLSQSKDLVNPTVTG